MPESWFEVVLKDINRIDVWKKTKKEQETSNKHATIVGQAIEFEHEFLKVTVSPEKWSSVQMRDYTYWIPYDSILFIKQIIISEFEGEK